MVIELYGNLAYCIAVLDQMGFYLSFIDHEVEAARQMTDALGPQIDALSRRLLEATGGDIAAFVREVHDGMAEVRTLSGRELVEEAQRCASLAAQN
jgi:hypothetical protein